MALLAPLLVFGLVIFVHELGHFLAAKAVGVYAPRFSIGFGPSIFRFRRGETEYILAWLPLGGYVRMASRHDAEAAFIEGGNEEQTARQPTDAGYDPEAMVPFGPKPVPEHRWFESKPLWARLLIMVAGVTMNIILAIVVATIMVFHHGDLVHPSTVIGGVVSTPAIPELANLQAGDTIRAVNGATVSTWEEVLDRVVGSPGPIALRTNRGDVTIPSRDSATARTVALALRYNAPALIDSVVAGDPAERAGLKHGDTVVAVGTQPIRTWFDMVSALEHSADSVPFTVHRAGGPTTVMVAPKLVEVVDSASGKKTTVRRIGAATTDQTQRVGVPFSRAMSSGWRITWSTAGQVLATLKQLVTGAVSVKELAGPIAITRASVSAARSGIDQLLYLITILSVNLAVLNLLPIPILDGGQIVINVLESARGRAFSMRTRDYILRVGLVAIGLLFVVVMYNDSRGLLKSLFGWF